MIVQLPRSLQGRLLVLVTGVVATVWLIVTTLAPGVRASSDGALLDQRTSTVCSEVSPAAIASTARSSQVRPPSSERE